MVEASTTPLGVASDPLAQSGRTLAVTLLAVLIALNIADLVSTHLVLGRGGSEGNPLVAPLIDGLWAAALVKGLVLVVIAVLALRSTSSRMRIVLGAVDLWYLAVVCWNFHLLTRL
jgi:hypothetical protein